MLERTSIKLYPIIKEVMKRMIPEGIKKSPQKEERKVSHVDLEMEKMLLLEDSEITSIADMKNVLGFLNQNEWVQ